MLASENGQNANSSGPRLALPRFTGVLGSESTLSPSPWFEAHRTFAGSPVSSLPAWNGRTPGASPSPVPLRSLSAVEESRQTKDGCEGLVPSILQRVRITSLPRLGTAGMIPKTATFPV